MIIRAKTFRQWFNANLKDYAEDIANHGADQGYPGITYYHDTGKLYRRFKDEIWAQAGDDAEGLGLPNVVAFVATFGRADDCWTATGFENLMVWYMAEVVAREMAEA